jgi:hypothetical protein
MFEHFLPHWKEWNQNNCQNSPSKKCVRWPQQLSKMAITADYATIGLPGISEVSDIQFN